MREIKFRGKSMRSGKWVQGLLIQNKIGSYIVTENNPHECTQYGYITIEDYERVYLESVGQYTGLKDKNGKEIHEGDIVEREDGEYSFLAKVVYNDWLFYLEGINPIDNYSFEDITDNCVVDARVIGSIYQHPHLLEVEK